jgi:putative ABC transport system ATP-binding protein
MHKPERSGAGDAVRLELVRKVYSGAGNSVVALDGVTIGFPRGSFTAVMGPSGSGKTTLLHAAAGLDRPTSGSVILDGRQVGLAERRDHRPGELSGGQQQRVAIARALVCRPAVVFADEPTGALDTGTAREVLGLLRESVQAVGQTVVMVTHDPLAASYADRVVFLADGQVVGQLQHPTVDAVAERMLRLGAWAERPGQPAWPVAGGGS